MIKSIQQTSSVKNSKVNVNVADFDIPEQTDLVDFLFVVDICGIMTCLMLGLKNQVIRRYGMVHVYFHEM